MSDDFRDPFSEAELNRILGEGSPRTRELTSALWKFFEGELPSALGDARTLGFAVIVELENTEGARALRYCFARPDGSPLPSWTARGYLADADSLVEHEYDRAVNDRFRPED